MRAFACPVCGGKLNIKIGTEYSACDSCGNVTKIDPAEAERFTRAYGAARLSMGLNSVAGYEAALRELDTISFIEEARKTRADCEKRLRDLQADLQRRQTSQRQDTSFAGVLLALPGRSGWSFSFSTAPCPPERQPSSSASQHWRAFSCLSTK